MALLHMVDGVVLEMSPEEEADFTARQAASAADAAKALVPATVSRFQFRKQLRVMGIFSDVDAAIAASNDVDLQEAWADATEFDRTSPNVAKMAATFKLTDEQVDAAFIAAAQIRA